MSNHADAAIQLGGVNKSFAGKPAVVDLDLRIDRGSLIGLIGPNGAGKTTTIRMIMSIIFPDSGTVEVLGRASAVESKDRIGYLPEERGVYKKMKVGTFLEYIARLKGVPEHEVRRRAGAWLERVALPNVWKKKCEELSKGMQQKVQFIASVIHEPDLIILDEPFSGLDPVNARLLRTLVDEQHDRGATIIFSTHQMSQAEALCDRVVMIHEGRKVLDDTPRSIRQRFDPRAILIDPVRIDESTAHLAAIPGVSGVARFGSGVIKVHLADGVDATAMIGRLAAAMPANRVEVERPTLEDVFIQIVSGSEANEEERARLLHAASSRDGGGD
ncbi:MAG TPA: ATP-binding cassette domain-containing protein [Phycisphaerales bacterium]|nr:ATP-binding cassette domain-containing protein [Phycisphaerales bacterium]